MGGMKREAYLAKADQELAQVKDLIEQAIAEYHSRRERGHDDIDVVMSLAQSALDDVVMRIDAGVVCTYFAVAVKMLHDERHAG